MMAIHAVHFYGFMKSNLSPAVVSCKKKGLGLFISYISQRERLYKTLSGRAPNALFHFFLLLIGSPHIFTQKNQQFFLESLVQQVFFFSQFWKSKQINNFVKKIGENMWWADNIWRNWIVWCLIDPHKYKDMKRESFIKLCDGIYGLYESVKGEWSNDLSFPSVTTY